jgi:hypothetical protein
MSSIPAPVKGRSVKIAGLPAPRLRVVPRPAPRAPRVPFVALVISVLAVGLVGLLVLNTSLQRRAYVVTDLRTHAAQLTLREQNLEVQVSRLESPERLAAVAAAAGMVRNDNPAFLSLATGKVLGVPKPGQAANSVVLYGAGRANASSKVRLLPAGSHNSGSAGIHHEPRTTDSRTGHRHGQPEANGNAAGQRASGHPNRSAR